MATFSVIGEREAPRPLKQSGRLAARMREYEDYVKQVVPGQVGKLMPGDGESPRGIALRIGRAARRMDKVADTWVVDDVVYFKARDAR
jgi:hypothetical protein